LEGIYGIKRTVFLYKRQQPFILGGVRVKHKSKILNEGSKARLKDLSSEIFCNLIFPGGAEGWGSSRIL